MLKEFAGLYNYWMVIILCMIGLYIVITNANLIKKIIGLSIFQTSVFLLYISFGKIDDGTAPIVAKSVELYSNPIPHVLILTAIVVGVATTAVALALAVRIHGAYRSLEEDQITELDNRDQR